jgi:hypothetical protein
MLNVFHGIVASEIPKSEIEIDLVVVHNMGKFRNVPAFVAQISPDD